MADDQLDDFQEYPGDEGRNVLALNRNPLILAEEARERRLSEVVKRLKKESDPNAPYIKMSESDIKDMLREGVRRKDPNFFKGIYSLVPGRWNSPKNAQDEIESVTSPLIPEDMLLNRSQEEIISRVRGSKFSPEGAFFTKAGNPLKGSPEFDTFDKWISEYQQKYAPQAAYSKAERWAQNLKKDMPALNDYSPTEILTSFEDRLQNGGDSQKTNFLKGLATLPRYKGKSIEDIELDVRLGLGLGVNPTKLRSSITSMANIYDTAKTIEKSQLQAAAEKSPEFKMRNSETPKSPTVNTQVDKEFEYAQTKHVHDMMNRFTNAATTLQQEKNDLDQHLELPPTDYSDLLPKVQALAGFAEKKIVGDPGEIQAKAAQSLFDAEKMANPALFQSADYAQQRLDAIKKQVSVKPITPLDAYPEIADLFNLDETQAREKFSGMEGWAAEFEREYPILSAPVAMTRSFEARQAEKNPVYQPMEVYTIFGNIFNTPHTTGDPWKVSKQGILAKTFEEYDNQIKQLDLELEGAKSNADQGRITQIETQKKNLQDSFKDRLATNARNAVLVAQWKNKVSELAKTADTPEEKALVEKMNAVPISEIPDVLSKKYDGLIQSQMQFKSMLEGLDAKNAATIDHANEMNAKFAEASAGMNEFVRLAKEAGAISEDNRVSDQKLLKQVAQQNPDAYQKYVISWRQSQPLLEEIKRDPRMEDARKLAETRTALVNQYNSVIEEVNKERENSKNDVYARISDLSLTNPEIASNISAAEAQRKQTIEAKREFLKKTIQDMKDRMAHTPMHLNESGMAGMDPIARSHMGPTNPEYLRLLAVKESSEKTLNNINIENGTWIDPVLGPLANALADVKYMPIISDVRNVANSLALKNAYADVLENGDEAKQESKDMMLVYGVGQDYAKSVDPNSIKRIIGNTVEAISVMPAYIGTFGGTSKLGEKVASAVEKKLLTPAGVVAEAKFFDDAGEVALLDSFLGDAEKGITRIGESASFVPKGVAAENLTMKLGDKVLPTVVENGVITYAPRRTLLKQAVDLGSTGLATLARGAAQAATGGGLGIVSDVLQRQTGAVNATYDDNGNPIGYELQEPTESLGTSILKASLNQLGEYTTELAGEWLMRPIHKLQGKKFDVLGKEMEAAEDVGNALRKGNGYGFLAKEFQNLGLADPNWKNSMKHLMHFDGFGGEFSEELLNNLTGAFSEAIADPRGFQTAVSENLSQNFSEAQLGVLALTIGTYSLLMKGLSIPERVRRVNELRKKYHIEEGRVDWQTQEQVARQAGAAASYAYQEALGKNVMAIPDRDNGVFIPVEAVDGKPVMENGEYKRVPTENLIPMREVDAIPYKDGMVFDPVSSTLLPEGWNFVPDMSTVGQWLTRQQMDNLAQADTKLVTLDEAIDGEYAAIKSKDPEWKSEEDKVFNSHTDEARKEKEEFIRKNQEAKITKTAKAKRGPLEEKLADMVARGENVADLVLQKMEAAKKLSEITDRFTGIVQSQALPVSIPLDAPESEKREKVREFFQGIDDPRAVEDTMSALKLLPRALEEAVKQARGKDSQKIAVQLLQKLGISNGSWVPGVITLSPNAWYRGDQKSSTSLAKAATHEVTHAVLETILPEAQRNVLYTYFEHMTPSELTDAIGRDAVRLLNTEYGEKRGKLVDDVWVPGRFGKEAAAEYIQKHGYKAVESGMKRAQAAEAVSQYTHIPVNTVRAILDIPSAITGRLQSWLGKPSLRAVALAAFEKAENISKKDTTRLDTTPFRDLYSSFVNIPANEVSTALYKDVMDTLQKSGYKDNLSKEELQKVQERVLASHTDKPQDQANILVQSALRLMQKRDGIEPPADANNMFLAARQKPAKVESTAPAEKETTPASTISTEDTAFEDYVRRFLVNPVEVPKKKWNEVIPGENPLGYTYQMVANSPLVELQGSKLKLKDTKSVELKTLAPQKKDGRIIPLAKFTVNGKTLWWVGQSIHGGHLTNAKTTFLLFDPESKKIEVSHLTRAELGTVERLTKEDQNILKNLSKEMQDAERIGRKPEEASPQTGEGGQAQQGERGSVRVRDSEENRVEAKEVRKRGRKNKGKVGTVEGPIVAETEDTLTIEKDGKDIVVPKPEPLESRRITDTQEFKDWSHGLPVILQGDPLPENGGFVAQAYHGSKEDIEEFRPDTTRYADGLMFFARDSKFAEKWPVSDVYKRKHSDSGLTPNVIASLKKEIEDWRASVDWARVDSDQAYAIESFERKPKIYFWESNTDRSVYPVYVRVDNPFDPRKDFEANRSWVLDNRYPGENTDALANYARSGNYLVYENPEVVRGLKDHGYDGIILSEGDGDFGTIAVWDNTQIKSAIGNRGTFDPNDPNILHSIRDTWYYSALEQAVENLTQEKWEGTSLYNKLLNTPGVKKEELEWLDVENFLKGKKSVTKTELAEYIKQNNVQVMDVTLGSLTEEGFIAIDQFGEIVGQGKTEEQAWYNAQDNPRLEEGVSVELIPSKITGEATRYGEWQTPGGENYSELLLTIPSIDAPNERQFHSSNYIAPAPIIAHVRFNERTDVDGKRVLFIEEIQSDLHQRGREKGYGTTEPVYRLEYKDGSGRFGSPYASRAEAEAVLSELGLGSRVRVAEEPEERSVGAPHAPFKKTWPILAVKRMLRYAAENGFDRIAWTTGDMQANRYDLSEKAKELVYTRITPEIPPSVRQASYLAEEMHIGDYLFEVINHDGQIIAANSVPEKELAHVVGKDIADKMLRGEGESRTASDVAGMTGEAKVLSGIDLKMGGEGMKGFYDQILPAEVNKYVKKWGGKVGGTTIIAGGKETPPPLTQGDRAGIENIIEQTSAEILDYGQAKERLDEYGYDLEPSEYDEILNMGASSPGYSPKGVKRRAQAIADAIDEGRGRIGTKAVHSLDITPEMHKAAMEGQPLFSVRDSYNALRDLIDTKYPDTALAQQVMESLLEIPIEVLEEYKDNAPEYSLVLEIKKDIPDLDEKQFAKFISMGEPGEAPKKTRTMQAATILGNYFGGWLDENRTIAALYQLYPYLPKPTKEMLQSGEVLPTIARASKEETAYIGKGRGSKFVLYDSRDNTAVKLVSDDFDIQMTSPEWSPEGEAVVTYSASQELDKAVLDLPDIFLPHNLIGYVHGIGFLIKTPYIEGAPATPEEITAQMVANGFKVYNPPNSPTPADTAFVKKIGDQWYDFHDIRPANARIVGGKLKIFDYIVHKITEPEKSLYSNYVALESRRYGKDPITGKLESVSGGTFTTGEGATPEAARTDTAIQHGIDAAIALRRRNEGRTPDEALRTDDITPEDRRIVYGELGRLLDSSEEARAELGRSSPETLEIYRGLTEEVPVINQQEFYKHVISSPKEAALYHRIMEIAHHVSTGIIRTNDILGVLRTYPRFDSWNTATIEKYIKEGTLQQRMLQAAGLRDDLLPHIGHGFEADVYRDGDSVYKLYRRSSSGMYPNLVFNVLLRPSIMNSLPGFAYSEVVGWVKGIGPLIKQAYISGGTISDREIADFMTGLGYTKVGNSYAIERGGYKHYLMDISGGNVVNSENGPVIIDAMIESVPVEKPLYSADTRPAMRDALKDIMANDESDEETPRAYRLMKAYEKLGTFLHVFSIPEDRDAWRETSPEFAALYPKLESLFESLPLYDWDALTSENLRGVNRYIELVAGLYSSNEWTAEETLEALEKKSDKFKSWTVKKLQDLKSSGGLLTAAKEAVGIYMEHLGAGTESSVYKADGFVYKQMGSALYNDHELYIHLSPIAAIEKVELMNQLPGFLKSEVLGITNDYQLGLVVRQPFLEGNMPSKERLETFMAQNGYVKVGPERYLYKLNGNYILVADVRPFNSRIVDGTVKIFDAVPSTLPPSEERRYRREIAQLDSMHFLNQSPYTSEPVTPREIENDEILYSRDQRYDEAARQILKDIQIPGLEWISNDINVHLRKNGSISLVGRKISDVRDLALMAAMYRDNRFETLRVFMIKNGEIVLSSGVSQKLPGAVYFRFGAQPTDLRMDPKIERMMLLSEIDAAKEWLQERAHALGADEIVMLHNHPNTADIGKISKSSVVFSDSSPSEQDLGYLLSNFGSDPRMRHQIVINDTGYTAYYVRGDSGAASDVVTERHDMAYLGDSFKDKMRRWGLSDYIISASDVLDAPPLISGGEHVLLGDPTTENALVFNENARKELVSTNSTSILLVGERNTETLAGHRVSAVATLEPSGLTQEQISSMIDFFRENSRSDLIFTYAPNEDLFDSLVQINRARGGILGVGSDRGVVFGAHEIADQMFAFNKRNAARSLLESIYHPSYSYVAESPEDPSEVQSVEQNFELFSKRADFDGALTQDLVSGLIGGLQLGVDPIEHAIPGYSKLDPFEKERANQEILKQLRMQGYNNIEDLRVLSEKEATALQMRDIEGKEDPLYSKVNHNEPISGMDMIEPENYIPHHKTDWVFSDDDLHRGWLEYTLDKKTGGVIKKGFREIAFQKRIIYQDYLLALKRLQALAMKVRPDMVDPLTTALRRADTHGPDTALLEFLDPYLQESLTYGKIGGQLEAYTKHIVHDLLPILKNANLTEEDLHEFMYAQHAVERNYWIAQRNPLFGKAVFLTDKNGNQIFESGVPVKMGSVFSDTYVHGQGSGVTNKEAIGKLLDYFGTVTVTINDVMAETARTQVIRSYDEIKLNPTEIIRNAEGTNLKEDHTELNRAAQVIYKDLQDNRDRMVQFGLISQETKDLIESMYKMYIPLRHLEAGERLRGASTAGSRIHGDEWKKATGRITPVNESLPFIWSMIESTIVRGHKNEVNRAVARFLMALSNPEANTKPITWEDTDTEKVVYPTPNGEVRGYTSKIKYTGRSGIEEAMWAAGEKNRKKREQKERESGEKQKKQAEKKAVVEMPLFEVDVRDYRPSINSNGMVSMKPLSPLMYDESRYVTYRENGIDHHIKINYSPLVQGLNNLTAMKPGEFINPWYDPRIDRDKEDKLYEDLPDSMKAVESIVTSIAYPKTPYQKVFRLMSQVYTSYSLYFLMYNGQRDAMTAALNMMADTHQISAQEWNGFKEMGLVDQDAPVPNAPWKTVLDMISVTHTDKAPSGFREAIDALGLLIPFSTRMSMAGRIMNLALKIEDAQENGKSLPKVSPEEQKLLDYYEEMKAHGGHIKFWGHKSYNDMVTTIKEIMEPKKKSPIAPVMKGTKAIFEAIRKQNDIIETATRFATYVAARDGGFSADRAADMAKNVTVNFNRKGLGGTVPAKLLKDLYMFANANIQGIARFGEVARKGKFNPFYRSSGALVALGFSSAFLSMVLGGDDDDGKSKWDHLDDSQKARNLLIPVTLFGEDKWFSAKLPFGYNIPFLIGQMLNDALWWGVLNKFTGKNYGRNPLLGGIQVLNSAVQFVDVVNTGIALDKSGGIADKAIDIGNMLLPSVAKLPYQLAFNRSWTGNQIYPMRVNPEDPRYYYSYGKAGVISESIANAIFTYLHNPLRKLGGAGVLSDVTDISPDQIRYFLDSAMGGTGKAMKEFLDLSLGRLALQKGKVGTEDIPFLKAVIVDLPDRYTRDQFNGYYNTLRAIESSVKRGELEAKDVREFLALKQRFGSINNQLQNIDKDLKALRAAGDKDGVELKEQQQKHYMVQANQLYEALWKKKGNPW